MFLPYFMDCHLADKFTVNAKPFAIIEEMGAHKSGRCVPPRPSPTSNMREVEPLPAVPAYMDEARGMTLGPKGLDRASQLFNTRQFCR